jgi:protein-L-isoaspartate(D-aspartate) O-methyltransferase
MMALLAFNYNCSTLITDTYKDKGARKQLIRELKTKGIVDDKVLNAMLKIPRHFFMHKDFRNHAYLDKAFRIGEGQTISQPFTVAYQTQLLCVEKGESVLEIGTGSGYQSAVLLELGANLTSIERHEPLHLEAQKVLKFLGYQAIFICGDGSLGYPKNAPYDKIIVTAGAPVVPKALIEQLKIGGILIIPVGDGKTQKMHSIIKTGLNSIENIELNDFKFVPLIGEQAWL